MSIAPSFEPTSAAQTELRQVIDRLVSGQRDAAAVEASCERMDRMREELAARIGIVEVAVDLIRDARNP